MLLAKYTVQHTVLTVQHTVLTVQQTGLTIQHTDSTTHNTNNTTHNTNSTTRSTNNTTDRANSTTHRQYNTQTVQHTIVIQHLMLHCWFYQPPPQPGGSGWWLSVGKEWRGSGAERRSSGQMVLGWRSETRFQCFSVDSLPT